MPEQLVIAPADHPALPGHFPGNAIIPGVVLLDWAWQAALAALPAGSELRGLPHAKFLAPVRPGDAVKFVITPTEAGAGFTASVAGRLVAQGSFQFASAEQQPL